MRQIIYCNCGAEKTRATEEREKMLAALGGLPPAQVLPVNDLCRLVLTEPQRLKDFAEPETAIIACQPRAVAALLAKLAIDTGKMLLLNLNANSAATICQQLGISLPAAATATAPEFIDQAVADAWLPWYPVVDQERCNNCGRCANFCLFGVYEHDAAKAAVKVAAPRQCKPRCPACARTCARGALIFPKHPTAPVNGGAGQNAETAAPELADLSDEDIYAILQKRRAAQKQRLQKKNGQ